MFNQNWFIYSIKLIRIEGLELANITSQWGMIIFHASLQHLIGCVYSAGNVISFLFYIKDIFSWGTKNIHANGIITRVRLEIIKTLVQPYNRINIS